MFSYIVGIWMVLKVFWFSSKHIITVIVNADILWYMYMYIFIMFIGPYGEQDDQQVFIQKVVPETNQLFIRLSSNGQR